MKITARTYDKTTWGAGPWRTEPDLVEFRHCDLPCVLHRNNMGAWCGYVGIPPTHPLHGKSYDEASEKLDAHGGLTYADACDASVACHAPAPSEPDDFWWFGFDCGHAFDLVPFIAERYRGTALAYRDVVYRDLAYVRAETEALAEQLRALAPARKIVL